MRLTTGAIIAAAALSLAACSSAPEPAPATQPATPTTTTAAPTPTPTELGAVGSVADLKDAAVAAGFDCPSWEQSNHMPAAAESGTCTDDDVFSTYTSQADRDEVVDFLKENLSGTGIELTLLVGENWIINSDTAAELEPELGGVLVKEQ